MNKEKIKIQQIFVSLFILSLSFLTRIYKIHKPNFVIWDEAHFGKFSMNYLKRKFYFDVHPPLGRLITTLFGWLSNQPLDFKFESANEYPKNFNYQLMRILHAFVGSLVPMFCELTLKELSYKNYIRYFIASLLIFDNGLVCISRLILLDSHLMAFTSAAVYFLCKYLNNKTQTNMFILGIMIGCVMSIKWVGCMAVTLIGIFIIYELLSAFCNKQNSFKKLTKMFLVRALHLIILPVFIYMMFFVLHFKILTKHSSQSYYVNQIFSLTLEKEEGDLNSKKLLKYIDYGQRIKLNCGKFFLHSHDHFYPKSRANQVTGYFHDDENNNWSIQKITSDPDTEDFLEPNIDIAFIHLKTRRYLGISSKKSVLSKKYKRAECKNKRLKETNIFQLEYVNDWNKKEDQIKAISTSFRIKFEGRKNMYLKITKNKYPDWGYNQQEVIFTDLKEEASVFTITSNLKGKHSSPNNPLYVELLKGRGLFFKFVKDLNVSMFNVNKSFTENEDEEPKNISSRPLSWFLMIRGIRMCSWNKEKEKYYMFINPFLWILSGFCITLTPQILLFKIIKIRRKLKKRKKEEKETEIKISSVLEKDIKEVSIIFLGYILHYGLFFFIGRVVYFHHYFPALYFAAMSIGYVFKNLSSVYILALTVINFMTFILYSPLTYGFVNLESVRHLKLLKTWDFI